MRDFAHNHLATVAAMTILSAAQAGVVIHVDDGNCPGPGDGSEAEPYCSIQTAIDAAVDTDEIVVAEGTYFETIDFLGKAITLRSLDPMDPAVVAGTVIDGGGQRVVTCISSEGVDIVISGLTITNGYDFSGGGMQVVRSNATVTRCTFVNNDGVLGGGLRVRDSSSTTVSRCLFIGNTAAAGGGLDSNNSVILVTDCRFVGNRAEHVGGGVHIAHSQATFERCIIAGNTAMYGGGLMNAVHSSPGQTMLVNCVVTGNLASDNGGGAANGASNGLAELSIVNCTFTGNAALTGTGGAVFNLTSVNDGISVVEASNTIFVGDTPAEVVNLGGTMALSYSNVDGGFPGTGNIDADPMFVDPDNGNYRLRAGSPCIDAGDNDAVPVGTSTDLDGNPRFLEIPETPDTGNGDLPIVDMGAYESLGGGCLAVTSQEIVCHADGTTFTVNVEGITACTGGTTQVTFTASGGAVGEEMCFTVLVNDEGFCCSTEICVTIPDCSPPVQASCPWDCGDGDGEVTAVDFFALIAEWGMFGTPCDFLLGPAGVDVTEFFDLVAHWGDCP